MIYLVTPICALIEAEDRRQALHKARQLHPAGKVRSVRPTGVVNPSRLVRDDTVRTSKLNTYA